MGKIENQEMKEELIDFAVNQLNNCKVFTDVFGKEFAKTSLTKNVDKVYTNIESKNYVLGSYIGADYSINLCLSGENEAKYSFKQLQENEHDKSIVFHELVHALLRKDDKNIRYGTGIFEINKKGQEIGRGLNEGCTNWIVKMCNIKPTGYTQLTRLANEIELAIGPERLMRMCKGKIRDIEKQLKMNHKETLSLLSITDEIYSMDKAIGKNKQKIEDINNGKNIEGGIDTNNSENTQIDIDIDNYNEFLREQNLQDSDKTKILYFTSLNRDYDEHRRKDVIKIESMIINKYYSKKCEKLINGKDIKFEEIENICELYKLLDKSNPEVKIIKDVMDKYYSQNISDLDNKIASKNFNLNHILHYKNILKAFNENIIYDYKKYYLFDKVAETLLPENPKAMSYLMQNLENDNDLDKLTNYSIIELETTEGTNYLYKGNDDKLFSRKSSELSISANQTIATPSQLFDFTERPDEDFNKIIKQFIYLKESINQANPNAKIKIVDRAIVVNDNENMSYYYIEGGEISPAKFVKELNIKDELETKEEKTNLPMLKKESIFKKIKNIFHKKNDEVHIEKEEVINKSKENTFMKSLSDMSNYSRQVTTPNVNLDDNKREKDETEEEIDL